MERTEKISIGHYTFALEEKAYAIIKEYIATLENNYLGQSDGAEIMDSIEARIAELLYERCGKDGVAGESDIRAIIEILGYPDNGNTTKTTEKENRNKKMESDDAAYAKTSRRLYRDRSNRIIAGVCGGLAQWLDIDPIWLRFGLCIISIALMFISGSCWFLLPTALYIILWICIPKATTAKQRWEMRGESGSVNDINRYRYEREHDRIDNYPTQKQGKGCLSVCLGIILLLIGLSGLVTKLSIFGGLLFTSFSGNIALGMLDWMPGMGLIHSMLTSLPITRLFLNPAIQILWTLICIIPSILLIYGGILLIFDVQTPKWRPGLCLFALWLILIVGIIPISYIPSRRAIKNIENVPTSNVTSLLDSIDSNIPKIKLWLEEHNFDDDDVQDLQEWLEEHNFNDGMEMIIRDSITIHGDSITISHYKSNSLDE